MVANIHFVIILAFVAVAAADDECDDVYSSLHTNARLLKKQANGLERQNEMMKPDAKGFSQDNENQTKRALLVIYGLQNRDRGCALPSHHRIRDALRSAGFTVDIYAYEMNPQKEKVDGVEWFPGSLKNISNTYESENMSIVDTWIYGKCGKDLAACQYSRQNDERYIPPQVIRALRQLYIEQAAARYLEGQPEHAYQLAVAVGVDVYFGPGISPRDIHEAAMASNAKGLFVSPNGGFGGYTNGFYMGSVSGVATAMNRFNFTREHIYNNYETQLKGVCDAAGLIVKNLTDHEAFKSFTKIRHSGELKDFQLQPDVISSIEQCLQPALKMYKRIVSEATASEEIPLEERLQTLEE